MIKQVLAYILSLLSVTVLLFSCSNTVNPFDDPKNVSLSILLKGSSDKILTNTSISESVGTPIQIGALLLVANLVDSVTITIKKYSNNTDLTFKFGKEDFVKDTLWHTFTFTKAGSWLFSATAYINNGDTRIIPGEIILTPKTAIAAINPSSIAATLDSMATFSVAVSVGDQPYTYQWYHDSTLLTNNTNVTIIISKVAYSDTGKYTCLVSDKWGDTVRTAAAMLSIKKVFSASISPMIDTIPTDTSVSFAVTAVGDTPFTYKWFLGATEITGQTAATLTIAKVAFTDSGAYTCQVKNKNNDSVTTSAAMLYVVPKVIINHKPVLSIIKGHTTILATEICTLTIAAADTDVGQTFTYNTLKKPAGSSFTGTTFIWAVPAGYLGTDTMKTDSVVFTVFDNGVPIKGDTLRVGIQVSKTIPLPSSVVKFLDLNRINGVFSFKWNKALNADGYQVFRSKDSATGFVSVASITDTSFTNTIKDTVFYYYIVATNSKGSASPSQMLHSSDVNTAPKWLHDTLKVNIPENSSISINLADSVKDINGDKITFQMIAGDPLKNTLVFSTWKDTATFSDSGSYTIKIQASDDIATSVLMILLHVTNVPRAPQPQTQTLSTNRNTALQITLSANDPDGDPITVWTIDTATTHGTAILTNSSQPTVTYIPATGFIGTDYFTFKATAGNQTSSYSAKVSIRVDTNNIAPVISQKLSAKTLNKGDSIILTISINQTAFPAPKYYWYKAGSFLDSLQGNTWKKANAALSDSGNYYVIVSNAAGKDSSGAKISMQMATTISPKLPSTTTVNAGSTIPISITVNSDATPAPGYQWYFKGTPIENATANSYSKTWAIADTGTYKVIATSAAGGDSSFTKVAVTVAPTGLTYTTSTPTYWTGVAIGQNSASVTGSVDSFTIAPALPTGLSLNKSTGAITGTPSVVTALATYIVTAKNQAGTTTANISITIKGPPTGLSYQTNPVSYWTGVAIPSNAASITGTVDSYTVAPQLPAGLTLTKANGIISGTPSVSAALATYIVTAKNQAGSTTANLTITVNGVPSAPTLSAPSNGTLNVLSGTSLTWASTTNAYAYRIQVSTDSNFVISFLINDSTLTGTSKLLTSPATSTKYYWRVNGKDSAGTGSWSAVWHFTTAPPPPSAPNLIAPIHDSSNVFVNTTLTWKKITGATYNIQVSTSKSFGTTLINSTGVTDTFKAITGLSTVTKYYWQASAVNLGGQSAFTVDSFVTGLNLSMDTNNLADNYNITTITGNSSNVFIGTYGGIFQATPGGTWSMINSNGCAAIAATGNIIFAGTYVGMQRSSDGGFTWKAASTGLIDSTNISSVLFMNGILYAATNNNGVYRSLDSSKSWTHISTGLRSLTVQTLVNCNGHLLAGTNDGVDYLGNDGQTWNNVGGLEGYLVNSLCANGNMVFAGVGTTSGMMVSSDFGQTWSKINSWPAGGPTSIAVSGNTLIAGSTSGGNGHGIWVSFNNGSTWYLSSDILTSTWVLGVAGHFFYNGVQIGSGLLRSPLP